MKKSAIGILAMLFLAGCFSTESSSDDNKSSATSSSSSDTSSSVNNSSSSATSSSSTTEISSSNVSSSSTLALVENSFIANGVLYESVASKPPTNKMSVYILSSKGAVFSNSMTISLGAVDLSTGTFKVIDWGQSIIRDLGPGEAIVTATTYDESFATTIYRSAADGGTINVTVVGDKTTIFFEDVETNMGLVSANVTIQPLN